MFNRILSLAAALVLAAGAVFAQAPGMHPPAAPRGERLRQFLATQLELTEEQKAQAKSIFGAARESALPIAQQLRQDHQAMRDAIKAGKSDAELDKLAGDAGALVGQLAAIHAKAFARFYALLTPEQKQKADQLHGLFEGMIRSRLDG